MYVYNIYASFRNSTLYISIVHNISIKIVRIYIFLFIRVQTRGYIYIYIYKRNKVFIPIWEESERVEEDIKDYLKRKYAVTERQGVSRT